MDYTYSGERLTKIKSNDGREIILAYSDNDLISSATTNERTWSYSYRDSNYVKHDWDVNYGGVKLASKVLDKVTKPDDLYWKFDLDGMQGEPSPHAKQICGAGGGALKIKHPNGAEAEFSVRDILHRQAYGYYSLSLIHI